MSYILPTVNVVIPADHRRGLNARNAMGTRSELGFARPISQGHMASDVGREDRCIRVGKERIWHNGFVGASYGTFVSVESSIESRKSHILLRCYWKYILLSVLLVIMGFAQWYGLGLGGEFGAPMMPLDMKL